MFSILTCADTNYYPMALGLARNVRLYPACGLYLYDLGLKDAERDVLRGLGVTVERIPLGQGIFALNSKKNIRATHKMDCINHFLRKYGTGVLVLDADALLIEDVSEEIFPAERDIVVTCRCDREKKPHILVNGKINTGVMAFGPGVGPAFFETWKSLCADGEHTDQSALSALLGEHVDFEKIGSRQPYGDYAVRVLDGNIYNDVTCRIGKIFHFKNAGRQFNKRLGFAAFTVAQRLFPKSIASCIALNRKYHWFVWRQ